MKETARVRRWRDEGASVLKVLIAPAQLRPVLHELLADIHVRCGEPHTRDFDLLLVLEKFAYQLGTNKLTDQLKWDALAVTATSTPVTLNVRSIKSG